MLFKVLNIFGKGEYVCKSICLLQDSLALQFAIMKEKLIYALYWADVLINYNLCKEFPIIFIFLYLFKLWLLFLFVLGKSGLNFCSFCQKVMKIEDFPEPDVCSLRKVDICRFENETQKGMWPQSKIQYVLDTKNPERKTHRHTHLTSNILSQVLGHSHWVHAILSYV